MNIDIEKLDIRELREMDSETLADLVVLIGTEFDKLQKENKKLEAYTALLRTAHDERNADDKTLVNTLSTICDFISMGAQGMTIRSAVLDIQDALYAFECSSPAFWNKFMTKMNEYVAIHKDRAATPFGGRLKNATVKRGDDGTKLDTMFIVESRYHYDVFRELNGFIDYSLSDVLKYDEYRPLHAYLIHRENRMRAQHSFDTPQELVDFLKQHSYYYLDYGYYRPTP